MVWGIKIAESNFAFDQKVVNDLAHPIFGDGTNGRGRNLQSNPLPAFRDIEFLQLQIGIKATLGLDIRMGNVVSFDGALAG